MSQTTPEQVVAMYDSLNESEKEAVLLSIVGDMKEEQLSELIYKTFQNTFISSWPQNSIKKQYVDFLLNSATDRVNADEVFARLTCLNMGGCEAEDFKEAVREYVSGECDLVSIKVKSLFDADRIREFVATKIYPYYNEQQAMIF